MSANWYIAAAIELGILEAGYGYSMDDVEITDAIKTRANYIDVKHNIRGTRNQLLQECDWTLNNDSPLTDDDKSIWEVYRQQLRDCTDNIIEGSENEFKFPKSPNSDQ